MKLLDWLVDTWMRVRAPAFYRAAYLAVAVGVGLAVFGLNDLLYALVAKPLGMSDDRQGTATVSVVFVTLGLVVLLIDRLAIGSKSVVFQNDRRIFGEFEKLSDWANIDHWLNQVHNAMMPKRFSDALIEVVVLLDNPRNRFEQRWVRRRAEEFLKATKEFSSFCAKHMFAEGVGEFRFFYLYPDHNPDRTGVDSPFFFQKLNELHESQRIFEKTYKAFVEAARARGLIT